MAALLGLEPSQSGCVVHPELRRDSADLVPPHVFRPRWKKRRAAIEELHVAVLILRDLETAAVLHVYM